jgi:hypothetical protein
VARTRFALARALAAAGGDAARARKLAGEARAAFGAAGEGAASRAREVDAWLAALAH